MLTRHNHQADLRSVISYLHQECRNALIKIIIRSGRKSLMKHTWWEKQQCESTLCDLWLLLQQCLEMLFIGYNIRWMTISALTGGAALLPNHPILWLNFKMSLDTALLCDMSSSNDHKISASVITRIGKTTTELSEARFRNTILLFLIFLTNPSSNSSLITYCHDKWFHNYTQSSTTILS